MAGVNKAIILGRLGQNPELTFTPAGMAICKFSLATSRKMKDGQEVTQWHRCTAFYKPAELISKYVSKGSMLYIEGEINYSQYEKDGVTRYSTDIIVREFNFISPGGGGGGGQPSGYENNQQDDRYKSGGGGGQSNPAGNHGAPYQSGGSPGGNSYGYRGNEGYTPQGPQGGGSDGSTPPKDDIPF